MIPPTDLRINNVVVYDKACHRVSGIIPPREPEGAYWIKFADSTRPRHINDLVPIELTGEWFMRLGFHVGTIGFIRRTGFRIKGEGYYLGFTANGGGVGYQFANPHFEYHIFYVHQLQNLFYSLTGRELELTQKLTQ